MLTPGGQLRHYSLCGDPRDSLRYRIAVLRCPDSRGGSASMHDALHAGSLLESSSPRNHFPLAPEARHSVLLAGGIGITPILCMARQLAADGASFELHYSCRSERHAAFRDELDAAPFAAHIHFHFSTGGGRLDLDTLLQQAAPGSHIYACGPAGFMDAVASAAQRHGWPDGQLHTERFGAGAGADPLAGAHGPAFDIRIASTGQLIRVEEGVSALAALAASGVQLHSSCGQGVCGSCVTGVLQGQPEHRDQCLTAAERARNDCFTPCCSRSRSPLLVLDL